MVTYAIECGRELSVLFLGGGGTEQQSTAESNVNRNEKGEFNV